MPLRRIMRKRRPENRRMKPPKAEIVTDTASPASAGSL
jgi:hypothetical protein